MPLKFGARWPCRIVGGQHQLFWLQDDVLAVAADDDGPLFLLVIIGALLASVEDQ